MTLYLLYATVAKRLTSVNQFRCWSEHSPEFGQTPIPFGAHQLASGCSCRVGLAHSGSDRSSLDVTCHALVMPRRAGEEDLNVPGRGATCPTRPGFSLSKRAGPCVIALCAYFLWASLGYLKGYRLGLFPTMAKHAAWEFQLELYSSTDFPNFCFGSQTASHEFWESKIKNSLICILYLLYWVCHALRISLNKGLAHFSWINCMDSIFQVSSKG